MGGAVRFPSAPAHHKKYDFFMQTGTNWKDISPVGLS